MAKLSNDKKYVTVESGDTLSQIALDYGNGLSYKKLAAINNISNPDYIYIGQKIYLSGSSSSSSSKSSGNMAVINNFGLQSNAENTLFATWTWSKSNTENYEYHWDYWTGDGVWFIGQHSTTEDKQVTYSIPSNATQVRFRVKPIAKTKGDNKVPYWKAEWTDYKKHKDASNIIGTPSAPTVTIDKFQLTAEVTDANAADLNAKGIQFQIVKDNRTIINTGTSTINTNTNYASYSCAVDAGGEYKVRCRAYSGANVGDWSGYSSVVITIPNASSGITKCSASSETSVYLEWGAVSSATSYEIEYATDKYYFDNSDQTTTKSGIENNHYDISGLESGDEYFFRVRAVNNEGSSAWSEIVSVVVGSKPAAPTTWSSTTTAVVGEDVVLYWVHNSEDGSSQTYAELELYINGVQELVPSIKNTEDEDEADKTSSYVISTSGYSEGAVIQWRVRTAGITNEFGDWSTQRTIDVYAQPTVAISVTDLDENAIEVLESFPCYVYALPGPNTQAPISYHLSVIANDDYETTDVVGNVKMVSAGDEVYSKHFDITDALLVELSANNIDLENGMSYTVKVTVAMDSGLTAENEVEFTVSWIDEEYSPNAEVVIDTDTYVAHIRPYCETYSTTYYKVTKSSYNYIATTEEVDAVWGEELKDIFTTTGEQVFSGILEDGTELYYYEVQSSTLVEDVTLSVYRREFDGGFTEIATGINNLKRTFVTDPHPALDYARYRIVAIVNATGAVSYYDLPGQPVKGKSIIIQWNDKWSNFDVTDDGAWADPAWSGSMLKLPYNIDVSDGRQPDVSLVEYVGRSHPVSYYGTQRGENATWNLAIDKSDKETLYAIRRLSIWMGDVYVREPSGSGYWANITVGFSQKHKELTIPVTLNIKRVEGGI